MKFLFFAALLALPVIGFGQDKMEQHYKIYSSAQGKVVSLDDIVADVANADVLFFGEEHTDSVAHYLELAIFKKLFFKYQDKLALSMEMFETDTQPVVDEYLHGLIREHNFLVDARAWASYKDYRPLIEMSKANHIDVVAANAPARYTNMVSRMGLSSLDKLDATGKSHLPPLPIDTASGKYYQKFLKIMGGHTNMGGQQIYEAQNLWDATMGWSIARYLTGHPGVKMFEVNGAFHSEEKLGTVAQFKKYANNARILTIESISGNDLSKPDFGFYTKMADYIILTDTKLEQ
jgi:uncharacterized iron-regulated protein